MTTHFSHSRWRGVLMALLVSACDRNATDDKRASPAEASPAIERRTEPATQPAAYTQKQEPLSDDKNHWFIYDRDGYYFR